MRLAGLFALYGLFVLTAACAAALAHPHHGAPRYRYLTNSGSNPAAAASYGWNLIDVSSKAAADHLPRRTRALVWIGNYDNGTCAWEVSDSELRSQVPPMSRDPKVAGFYVSDEPDPYACPNAPAQHRRRSRLLHMLAPRKLTVMVMDSNSGRQSIGQMTKWSRAADYVGLDPYPCYRGKACDYPWITAIIKAADRAGLRYWGVVQAFGDSTWRWPTASEERHMLAQWTASNESGYMTFAWNWRGGGLSRHRGLLRVLKRFNSTARR